MKNKDEQQWKPDFKKWDQIDLEAYKFIFEQAKLRFEDVLSESESITNKSIKMIIGLITIFGFFIGFLFQNHITLGYNVVFIGFFIFNILGILYLIFPKEIRNRGISAEVLIPKDLDSEEDRGYELKLLYYSAIVIVENNIIFMVMKNNGRAKIYLASLIMMLILFVAGSTYIAISL